MLERVHHIAFVVGDLDAATTQFEESFGPTLDRREEMSDEYHLEVAVYDLEGVLLELISPTRDEGWVADYWQEHGDGFFHIAFEVPDITAALETLRARGIEADGPNQGLDWLVATLDDDETVATMQIVEDVGNGDGGRSSGADE